MYCGYRDKSPPAPEANRSHAKQKNFKTMICLDLELDFSYVLNFVRTCEKILINLQV